jgi:hypothetical protein
MNCAGCGVEQPPGTLTCPNCGYRRAGVRPLLGLGNLLCLVMAFDVIVVSCILLVRWLHLPVGRMQWPIHNLDGTANLTSFVFGILFLVWFRRARINAEGRGWRKRRATGWTIGGWICPVVNLWFPFQIMGDIWRAGLAPEARQRTAWLPALWWTAWLLSGLGVTAGRMSGTRRAPVASYPATVPYVQTWMFGLVMVVICGVALIAIIRKVSAGPVGRPPIVAAAVAVA